MTRTLLSKIIIFSIFIFTTLSAKAVSVVGNPDLSFNQIGHYTVNLHGFFHFGSQTVIQPDGKILMIGRVEGHSFDDWRFHSFLMRFNPDGSPDRTFGSDGQTLIQISPANILLADSLALTADGKIVIAGNSRSRLNNSYYIARFTSTGNLDTNFGIGGFITGSTAENDDISKIAIQSDGKIVGVGNGTERNVNRIFAARFSSEGIPDPSFGTGGTITTSIQTGISCSAIDFLIQPDGKLVVGGKNGGFDSSDFALIRYNSDGSLDSTFGSNGIKTTHILGSETIFGLALQPDGKIIAAGQTTPPNPFQTTLAVARYDINGNLDKSFDSDGIILSFFPLAISSPYLSSVVVQPNGKIIAAGRVNERFALFRYEADGRPDPSYGSGGQVFTSIDTENGISSIALQPDEKIVAIGYSKNFDRFRGNLRNAVGLARYTSTGTLDPTFDGDGKLAASAIPSYNMARSMLILPNGKIIVGGYSWDGFDFDFGLMQFNYDGTPDNVFNHGLALTGIGTKNDILTSIDAQADGKIIAAGYAFNGLNNDFALVRFKTDGKLDPTFDGDGKVLIPVGNGDDLINDMVVQPDGKIIVAGQSIEKISTIVVARFNPNGTLDSSFANGGWKIIDVGTDSGGANAVALQTDGKIIVAGYTKADNSDFVVVRLNSNGILDQTFGTKGIVTTSFGSQEDFANAVIVQNDSKIIAAGKSGDNANSDFALVRFNSNGSLDTTFGTNGKLTTSVGRTADVANSVKIQSDGKILAIGSMQIENGSAIAMTRYTSNGAPDTTFGNSGVLTSSIGNSSGANDATLESNGKILIAGFSESRFLVARYQNDLSSPAPYDFDGDGKTDLSIFRQSTGEWWLNQSSLGIISHFNFYSVHKIAPADFTGDGRTNIAYFTSSGEWGILSNGDFTIRRIQFGISDDIPMPGDYDGDGKADIAVFRPSDSNWYIRKSTGSVLIERFGQVGDKPIPADYDGDGKTDIAVFRPSTGQWWLNRSSFGITAVSFGSSTDKIVPGDYTGDGKADVAFWRPTTGEWFILRSENASFYSFPFGASGDLPVPGDYDGDGKWDAGVFRPANANWYLNRSTAGVLIQNFGLSTDFPVPSAFTP